MKKNSLALLGVIALLCGCAVSTDRPTSGTPPIQTGERTTMTPDEERTLPSTVAIMPLANDTGSDFAFEVVRRTIANHFATTNYRWLHWRDVDRRLALAGVGDPTALEPADAMALLGVDGLIVGRITHFDKTFAGIYSQIAVGVELNFVDAEGETLWSVDDVRRSHAGGISTSPVGLIMSALASAKHLYGDANLYRAADDLGRDLVSELPQPAVLGQSDKPDIIDVVHSGAGQYLKYGDTLEIALEGDPGNTAAAMIEGMGVVDLEEVAPGQYAGSVTLSRDLDLDGVVVEGRLQDEYGQTSSWISPYGLLTVDNTPPPAVFSVTSTPRSGAVSLRWESPNDQDIAAFEVARLESSLGQALASMTVQQSSAEVTGLTDFRTQTLTVRSVDRAGNLSDPVRVETMAAPDARFAGATIVDGTMPDVISGIHRLTAQESPYRIDLPTRIATDGVLLIEPGVTIEVGPAASMTVLGEIHAFGTQEAPVTVSDADGQGYSEFLVLQTERPVRLQQMQFVGGGLPLQILAGSPLIESSSFNRNRFSAISIGGTARPTIRNCRIEGAGSTGVIVEGQAQPVFIANGFNNNQPFHLQNGSTYQVNLSGNRFEPAASAMTVLGDVLLGEE